MRWISCHESCAGGGHERKSRSGIWVYAVGCLSGGSGVGGARSVGGDSGFGVAGAGFAGGEVGVSESGGGASELESSDASKVLLLCSRFGGGGCGGARSFGRPGGGVGRTRSENHLARSSAVRDALSALRFRLGASSKAESPRLYGLSRNAPTIRTVSSDFSEGNRCPAPSIVASVPCLKRGKCHLRWKSGPRALHVAPTRSTFRGKVEAPEA